MTQYSLITDTGEEFIGEVVDRKVPTQEEINGGVSVCFNVFYEGVELFYRIKTFAGMVHGTDIVLDCDLSRELENMRRARLDILYGDLAIARTHSPERIRRMEKEIRKFGGEVGPVKRYQLIPGQKRVEVRECADPGIPELNLKGVEIYEN